MEERRDAYLDARERVYAFLVTSARAQKGQIFGSPASVLNLVLDNHFAGLKLLG
jgi:hypothetical protein